MKKLLFLTGTCLLLSACGNFNTKQEIDDTYYKKTQSVAWPESPNDSYTSKQKNGAGYGASDKANPQLNWQDPTTSARQLAIPEMPEKKLQCVKTGRESYTCRIGQYQCGTGCRSDGSHCRYGYCLQSDCDDVLGQKWDLVYERSSNLYTCEHPTTKVSCRPDGAWNIACRDISGHTCGYNCNKNGTQCADGADTCWSKYRDV